MHQIGELWIYNNFFKIVLTSLFFFCYFINKYPEGGNNHGMEEDGGCLRWICVTRWNCRGKRVWSTCKLDQPLQWSLRPRAYKR